MKIAFPGNTREVINAIRQAIGRDIVIHHVVSQSGCSVCSLDPITNLSTDPYCPVCSGNYWIPIYSSTTRTAHVFWKKGQEIDWLPGGIHYDSDVTAQIEFSGNIETYLDNADYILIDNKKFEEKERTYRGVTTINRIILFLKEIEKEN